MGFPSSELPTEGKLLNPFKFILFDSSNMKNSGGGDCLLPDDFGAKALSDPYGYEKAYFSVTVIEEDVK